jgi:ferritin-like metal-binding protein YciE
MSEHRSDNTGYLSRSPETVAAALRFHALLNGTGLTWFHAWEHSAGPAVCSKWANAEQLSHQKGNKGQPMQITSFKDMYIAELQELASLEAQLGEALLELADVASHPSLKEALTHHREQTLVHEQRLGSMLQKHGANPRAHTDQAMQALISETEKMTELVQGAELRDSAIIASAQKVEHYEIAAYGSAAAMAGQLGIRDDQQLLHRTLEEEKAADSALTRLAQTEVNKDALPA